jgi:hypothetical protein
MLISAIKSNFVDRLEMEDPTANAIQSCMAHPHKWDDSASDVGLYSVCLTDFGHGRFFRYTNVSSLTVDFTAHMGDQNTSKRMISAYAFTPNFASTPHVRVYCRGHDLSESEFSQRRGRHDVECSGVTYVHQNCT